MDIPQSSSPVVDGAGAETSCLVSIGMPVYNEGRFLEESLDSILTQDYRHTELIISDNASTDETETVSRRIAAQDSRVAYYRYEKNHGATENFRRVLRLAKGRYFMWASGHDLWSSNLISECVKTLENRPDAIVAFASSKWIDPWGNQLARFSGWTDTSGMDRVARLHAVLWGNMHAVLGVIRAEALERTHELKATAGADLILLSELVLQGHFVHAPAACWSRRDCRGIETHEQRIKRYQSPEFGLSKSTLDRVFPLVRLPFELIRVVLRSRISWSERMCILFSILPALPVRYFTGRKRDATNGPSV